MMYVYIWPGEDRTSREAVGPGFLTDFEQLAFLAERVAAARRRAGAATAGMQAWGHAA